MSEDKREMPECTEQQTGTCMYCGQTMLMHTIGAASREQLDKWATEKCTCEQAKVVQERVKAKRTAENNIQMLVRSAYPEIETIMKNALPYIEDDNVFKVTIDTGTGVKGSICKTAKGAIKVEMATSSKRAIET